MHLSFLLLSWCRILVSKSFCMMKNGINRGHLIVENASIPEFPDAPEKEDGHINKSIVC